MPLTPADVRNMQFSTTRIRPGYNEQDVDAFLRRVEGQLDLLIKENEALRANRDSMPREADLPEPARQLTAADVRKTVFRTTRLKPGYEEREVDTFLDQAEAEIGRLIKANDELRAGI